MKRLIITVDRNTPGKHDFNGAFQPESFALAKKWGVARADIVNVDLGKPEEKRRRQVLTAVASAPPGLEVVAFLCHGLRTRLPQLGWNRTNVGTLAGAIAKVSPPTVRVVLYACSTGEGTGADGDGGFADAFRDALCVAGATDCQVDAHERAAHTTKNPYLRRFQGLGAPSGGAGGGWIVTPKSAPWKSWRKAIDGPMRFAFPMMTTGQILAAL